MKDHKCFENKMEPIFTVSLISLLGYLQTSNHHHNTVDMLRLPKWDQLHTTMDGNFPPITLVQVKP